MNYLIIQFSNAAIDSHQPVKCRVENINLNKQNNGLSTMASLN